MQSLLTKTAGAENSGLTDPRTGLPIYITTSVRMLYRKYYGLEKATSIQGRDYYGDKIRNAELNPIIAKDFADSADNTLHMYPSKKTSGISGGRPQWNWIEFRKFSPAAGVNRPFNIFVSIITPDHIIIVKIGPGWKPVSEEKRRVFIPRR
jgi:hypothetical protein